MRPQQERPRDIDTAANYYQESQYLQEAANTLEDTCNSVSDAICRMLDESSDFLSAATFFFMEQQLKDHLKGRHDG